MSILRSHQTKPARQASWQDYQHQLKQSQRFPKRAKWIRWILGLMVSLVLMAGIYIGWTSQSGATTPFPEAEVLPAPDEPLGLSRKDVQLLLAHAKVDNLENAQLDLHLRQERFQLHTSIDHGLQTHLLDVMDRKNSRHIAIVAMDAQSGRILALAGFDKNEPERNPCLESSFPAASLFKIVTAAAAVEVCGLKPSTSLYYNGDKYTLYKSQLKESHNRYTRTVSFKDSFAQSVNPIFGKLGLVRLKKTVLAQYGEGFGFNREIDFELRLDPSRLHISETPYNWAEIACGFNNTTTLSPIHAAMMVSAVVNQGEMILPTIVDRITDDEGTVLYQARPQHQGRAMTGAAAQVLTQLMEATVKSGTARKAFRGKNRDRTLASVTVGGKTGSISNLSNDERFDWFVGFARGKNEAGQLVVAALVGHEEYIGIRAAAYARKTISYYFKNHLAQKKNHANVPQPVDL